ncbi:BTAD domain-containing putative transcriptional regulator [Sphaerisporangium viridialbum]|uniref:BTAD domain-containing putative transcriptional regulator n=1 Tax=Sphaerisporangium viridialbum TaxID=46189 RepID=UPI003C75F2F2
MFFGILGSTEAWRSDGSPARVGGPRVRLLLALLLVDAGQVVGTQRLIDGLYGENPPADAANALQSQVSRLRRGLGPEEGRLLELHAAGYRLAVDPDSVDAHRFQRLAREGRRALADGDPSGARAHLGEALRLWRGPALADVPFAGARATGLEELRLAALEDRVQAELALGGHREVVAELFEVVAAHPLRERPRAQLMRALYGCGRQAEALAVFEDGRRLLAEELGADPSADLTTAHLAILRADPSLTQPSPPSSPPPPRAAPASPSSPGTASDRPAASALPWQGVPAQLTSFVGREEELRRVGKLLGAGRLVTIIGPGGAGKTRLAVEAGEREQGQVCFVDLAPLGEGTRVPQAVLSALGLREAGLSTLARGPSDVMGRLLAALADRRLLLILDNCEHVIDEAARLARRLLGGCAGVRVLATSREALGITGEALCPLPPLGLPAGNATVRLGVAGALRYPAVRLFADRAAAVSPDFVVDDSNAAAVMGICVALDGLPLAIELAAARLRALPVREMAVRLGVMGREGEAGHDRFGLLSRGDRTAAERHQTLRAVVAWSWELLDAEERVLARRLTVFRGSATLEAIEQVCDLPEHQTAETAQEPRGAVVGVLAGLVDKSLVEVSGGRYRMLETIRMFCAERLADAGEAERLRESHARYFAELASTAEPCLRRTEQLEWLARLTLEHANLQAALRWAVSGDPVMALELLANLSVYWWLRGLPSEGGSPAAELLRVIGTEPPAGQEDAYVACVVLAGRDGFHAPGLWPYRERARAIMRSLDRAPRQPFTMVLWAMATGPAAAEGRSWEGFGGADAWLEALSCLGEGFGELFGGRVEEARPAFTSALHGFRSVGDRWGTMQALDALAVLAEWRGDRATHQAMTEQALELAGQLGAAEDTAEMLYRLAHGLLRQGDPEGARATYERAGEVARTAGLPAAMAGAWFGFAELARLRGDLAEARRFGEMALSACASEWVTTGELRTRILVGLGRIAEAGGDPREAESRHAEALDDALSLRHLLNVAGVAEALAGVALLRGDGERAALLLGAGTALRGATMREDPDVPRVAAASKGLIGATAFAAAYERGAAMTPVEALVLAGVPPEALDGLVLWKSVFADPRARNRQG